MSDIRIRVGASADATLTNVFRPLVEASKKARAALDSDAQETGKALPKAMKSGTSAAEKAYQELVSSVEGGSKKMMGAGTKAITDFGKEAQSSFKATKRGFEDLARDAEKAMKQIERAQRAPTPSMGARAGGAISSIARVGSGALSFASRLGADLLRGAGVNTDVGSMFAANNQLETQAVNLSNSGYMKGQAGPNGQRQDPAALIRQVRDIANATAMDPTKAMEGLQSFTGKTGDLQTGRDILGDMAKLSRATGTELQDMVSAAGDVSNALGETDNKGAKVAAIMKTIAAQGKTGAVEIKDLAVQMAKLGAASGQFDTSPEKALGEMGALAQMARAHGGAASAPQAATAVTSFMNLFSKGARLDAFQAHGVKIKDEHDRLLNPREIIAGAIAAASKAPEGFDRAMGKMFADTKSRQVTRGFENEYKKAGGGKAGIDAVRKAFDDLADATLDATEVQESFSRSMNTTEAKAQVFNNKLTEAAGQIQTTLVPALVALAPAAIAAANALAWIIGKVADPEASPAGDAYEAALQNKKDIAHGEHALSRGEITDARVKKNQEDEAAMQRQIAQLDASIKEREAGQGKASTWLKNQVVGSVGAIAENGDFMGALTGSSGNAFARQSDENLASDKQLMSQLLQTMKDVHNENKIIAGAIAGGKLKVIVANPKALPSNNPGAKSPTGAIGD